MNVALSNDSSKTFRTAIAKDFLFSRMAWSSASRLIVISDILEPSCE